MSLAVYMSPLRFCFFSTAAVDPVFVIVTSIVLLLPTFTAPKFAAVGLKVSCPAPCAAPAAIPVNVTNTKTWSQRGPRFFFRDRQSAGREVAGSPERKKSDRKMACAPCILQSHVQIRGAHTC